MARVEDPETAAVAAMLQGYLAMTVKTRDGGNLPIKVRDVEITTDPRGDYHDHFTVVTESGARIQVRVRPE